MFKRICSFIASALFMALLLPTNAHAIELTQLTPNFDATENLEIITPPTEGYNFELNILANDQTADYSATIRNDHDVDIKVTSIDFSDSEYEFLDYSYDGIYIGDIIPAGSSKTISLTIKSSSTTTRTITEDYSLVIHYEKVSPPSDSDNPNTSSNNTILTTVIILAGLSFAVFFVLKKSTNRRHFAFLFLLPIAGLLFFAQNTNAEESLSFGIKGKIHFTNVYTVTINPNGGIYQNSTNPTITKLREGETYHVSAATRDTYEFVSWEVSTGTLDDNNDIEVHSDINIKALWNEIYYTLTIKPNGGIYGGSEQDYTESFRPNEYADILTPTRTGYDFTGWTSSTSESVSNNRIKITEDTTITANWSIKRLSLTINPNGGKFNGSAETYSATVDYGTIVNLTNITRDNHEFKNWTKNSSDILPATVESITITEDTSLIANWIAFYTVTINPNGGVYEGSTEIQTNSYREGTEITIGTPSRDTYTFSGWNISTGSLSENKYVVNSDVTFTATWNEITHTVTIDPNGGSYDGHNVVFSTTYHEGTEVQILTPTRSTYRFTGWTATPNILSQDNKLVVSEDVTLVANWEEIYYNLTIDPNGGTYGDHTEEFTTTYRMGTVVNLTTPTKEHYSFSHWQLEDESTLDGSSVEIARDIKLVAIYDIDRFLLTIDPNGGTYNGHPDIMITTVDYGTVVDLTNTSREGFDLKNWTKNNTDTLEPTTESITITEDTKLVANWWSSTFYTVTINPNGGVYNNTTEPSEYRVRKDETYSLLEATYANHIIVNIKFDDDTILNSDHFTVTRDITLTYYWEPAVARIERTQKLYSSIMKAEAEAQTDDIITLLVDTEEVVTNEKKVTLDLNTHTVTGYLTNTAAGDITIINGEINNYTSPIKNESNPSGAAVINNGILTIGVDDYEDGANHTKRATIVRDNVRLIGSDIGLVQNNTFYFYDGFIEGVIGLDGSYNGSPWFRDTFDGVEIHYFPFVDHNAEKDCQHVELESSDRAVSKTINGGEIYYYNLQDNIDTSALTHYDIYIVRNFEATYEVTVPEDTTINLDLDGYTIEVADNWENNGTFNIRNSHPSDETTNLAMSRTFVNNGQLNISNISASSVSANTMLALNNDINISNSNFISKTNATIFEVTGNNVTFTADQETTIKTTNTDQTKYPFLNSAKNTTINGGTFISNYRTIVNTKNNTLTIEDGDFSIDNYGSIIYNSDGTLTVNGGNIHSTISSSSSLYGIYGGLVYFNDGTIDVTNRYSATGINASYSDSIMAGGTVSATSTYYGSATGLSSIQVIKNPESNNIPTITATGASAAYGIYNSKLFDGGIINAIAGTGAAYGGQSLRAMESGTINATSTSGIAYGITNTSYTINDGTITATSENNDAYGAQVTSATSSTTTSYQHGGTIIAHTSSSNKEAIGTRIDGDEKLIIDGGSVSGDNYGIKASNNNLVTLGTLDEELNKNQLTISGGTYGIQNAFTDFYDGTIIGGSEDYINDRTNIKAIPAGATYHIETIDGKVNCWLVEGAKYIRNTRTGHEFNSLDAAYDDEEIQDGDTLEVIDDFSTEAVLPDNTHNITLDLHGKHLTYSQPLLNSGVLTITDLSDDKDGVLENINQNQYAIDNTGTLTIEAGNIKSIKTAIYSTSRSTVNINGGTIKTYPISSATNHAIITRQSTLNITGGHIGAYSDTNSLNLYTIGLYSSTVNITGGKIEAISTKYAARGITTVGSSTNYITIDGAEIYAQSGTFDENDVFTGVQSAYALDSSYNRYTINQSAGKETKITAVGRSASAIYNGYTPVINGGTLSAYSTTDVAYAINRSSPTITGGHITAYSEQSRAIAVGYENASDYTLTMSGGTLEAHISAENTTNVAYGVDISIATITSGTIIGDVYGIHSTATTSGRPTSIGTLNDTLDKNAVTIQGGVYGISGGYINFYDGTIIGGSEDYINDRTNIKAIPAGATYHIETIDGRVNCWLVEGAKYIRNTRTGHEFNSLDAAYDNEEIQDGDTLEVIDDFSTEAVLPDNTHNITLDLHGKHLTYSQPLLNSGVLTITDLSDDKDGVLEGINASSDKPTINNTGSLILESGTIRGAYYAINTSDSFIQKGGTVITEGSSAMAPIYVANGTAKINDGNIIINDSQNSNAAGINRYSGEAIINGGHIQANGIVSGISGIYESGNTSRTTTINGGLIEVSSTTGTAYGVKYGYVYINQTDDSVPVISVTAPQAYGISAGSIKGYIHGGIITATGTTSSAYGISNAKEVSNATITVNAYAAAYGIDGYTATIDSGTITTHSETSDSYGLRASCSTYSICNFAISGGTITATGDDLTKIIAGVYHVGDTRQALITGGDIYGDVYGYYAGSANLKIIVGENDSQYHNGIDDSEISPSITGGSYGLYKGSVEFYDGRLVGGIAAHYDRNIKLTATNAYVYTLTDGEGRDVRYVSSEKPLARIDSTPYMSIADAVAAAEPHDTITLTEDNYIYSNLNIPAEKDITIDLDGYTIVTGNPITNNGKVTIMNGKSGTDPLIDYRENNVFITNKSNAELTIDGIKIKVATNAILNEADAKLSINNATITGEDSNSLIEDKGECDITNSSIASNRLSIKTAGSTSITNSSVTVYENDNRTYGRAIQVDKPGSVTVDNSQITILSDKNSYPDYAFVVANGSSVTISNNSTITGRTDISGSFSASSSTFYHVSKYNLRSHNITTNGYMSLTDCDITMSQSGDSSSGNFTNVGTLILTDSDITTTYMINSTNRNSNTTIYTNNTTVIDNTDINVILTEIDRDSATRYAIYNKNGSTRIKNGSDIAIKTNSTGTTYGIYIENSTIGLDAGVTMTDSTLRVEAPKAIGAYVPNGQFTMGEKETDPSKIGTDIANMTTPSVTAIGSTSGIGVQKTNGIFEFYDGVVIGNIQSITALPTETEYWYETKKTVEADGYEHCVLDYMRNNPNANTNELGD